MKQLVYLNVRDNIISDIRVLTEMTNLMSVDIYGNPVTNATLLRNHTNIINGPLLDYEKIEQAGKKAHQVIREIIRPGMSALDKEVAVYQYILNNTEYDYQYYNDSIPTAEDPAGIYGVLINGYAVCDGYALAMKVLGQLAGLDCLYIAGTVLDEGHAWNMIGLEGEYYHLDATWDDGGQNVPTDYKFFNVSSSDMENYGQRVWDAPKYPQTSCYSRRYIEHCKFNGVDMGSPLQIKGSAYMDSAAVIDVNFGLIISVYDKLSNVLYEDTLKYNILPAGEQKCELNFTIPNDKNFVSYTISTIPLDSDVNYRLMNEGVYINSPNAVLERTTQKSSLEKAFQIKIDIPIGDYSIYNPAAQDYTYNLEEIPVSDQGKQYVLRNIGEIVLPPHSALLAEGTFLGEDDIQNMPTILGNVILENHSDQAVFYQPDSIWWNNPGIKDGMKIYVRLIVFSNDFQLDQFGMIDYFGNPNIIYGGRWIPIAVVPEQEGQKEPEDAMVTLSPDNQTETNGNLSENRGEAIEKDGFYYVSEQDTSDGNYSYNLVKVNIATGQKIVLANEKASMMRINDGNLYYRGSNSNINKINLDTHKKELAIPGSKFTGGLNGWMHITDEGVYYISQEEYRLHLIPLDTMESTLVLDNECQDAVVVENAIYYRNSTDNHRIYKYDIDRKTNTKVSDKKIMRSMITNGKHLYFMAQDETNYEYGLYRMNFDGSGLKVITKGYFDGINIDEGKIYALEMGKGLFRLNPSGSKTQMSKREFISSIIIGETGIYLVGPSSEFVDRISK